MRGLRFGRSGGRASLFRRIFSAPRIDLFTAKRSSSVPRHFHAPAAFFRPENHILLVILSPFCYFLYFPMQVFPVAGCPFSPKVGLNILFYRQNLDKSGSCVYTKYSFPAGNKSYNPIRPPPGERPGRESFSGGTLVSTQTLRNKLYEFWELLSSQLPFL